MDYLEIRELYHNNFKSEEKKRRKSNLIIINKDFMENLPYPIRNILDEIIWNYKNESWFEEAWEKYRKLALDAGVGGKIPQPVSVFGKYIDEYVDKYYDNTGQYIAHHGIKGQRWGIRRFQNEDGSLTAEGKQRYDVAPSGNMSKAGEKLNKLDTKMNKLSKQDKKQGMSKGALAGGALGVILGLTAAFAGADKAGPFGSLASWIVSGPYSAIGGTAGATLGAAGESVYNKYKNKKISEAKEYVESLEKSK